MCAKRIGKIALSMQLNKNTSLNSIVKFVINENLFKGLPTMKLINCRICNGEDLTNYLNLGSTPAADAFVKEENKHLDDPFYPLEVCLCKVTFFKLLIYEHFVKQITNKYAYFGKSCKLLSNKNTDYL